MSGAGALHEEVLNGDEDGIFHMAQLWINVPASLKMNSPEHHAVVAEQIPELRSLGENSLMRLYAGDLAGQSGPAPMPTPVLVAHVSLDEHGSITIPVPAGWAAAFTVVAGSVAAAGQALSEGDTPVFNDDGDTISLTSDSGGQVLLMSGEPIGEPIAMGGGFVMNTAEEISIAFDDYQSGRMGSLAASR